MTQNNIGDLFMPILENKLVDELVKATLAVFESVFASKYVIIKIRK